IRPHRDGDDEAVVMVLDHSFPQLPREGVEGYQHRVRRQGKEGLELRRFVAEVQGAVVGASFILRVPTDEPDIYFLDVTVVPDHRHRGIGSAMAAGLLQQAQDFGARTLLAEISADEPYAMAFIAKHGFEPNGRGEQLARLDVEAANLDGFEDAEATLGRQNLRIELMKDLDLEDPDLLQSLYRLDMDTHRDIPSSVEWKDISLDEFWESIVNGPGRSPEWAWVALDGTVPVGVARLRVFPDGKALNAYTGTRSDYRGRGIARALKNRTVQWCREHGIRWVYTGNEVENHRMLAINRSLGYEPLPRSIEVVRHLKS
ncbi:MAG TPA: GNAT family N-acetyltransferase, partial [Chloroflexota bacterium]|nr:GNAT family N-acetyltransferase [Chloroflexota bacterium]